MEVSTVQAESSLRIVSEAERSAEIAEQERIREMQMEQQAQVEMRARSPEQSAGQIIDQIV
jgi:hypothetical protein